MVSVDKKYTQKEAIEIIDKLPIRRKSRHPRKGSNYDFIFHNHVHYVSYWDVVALLQDIKIPTLYCSKEEAVHYINKILNKLGE